VTIIGATGHQHIPGEAIAQVASGIDDVLRQHQADLVGVCSLAGGADQLFAQAVLDAGGALHVVVPCQRYDETFSPGDLSRYHELLAAARGIEALEHPKPTEAAFLDAGYRVADLCDVLVAVWDGEPARGLGGTADVVEYARAAGREIAIIWPPCVVR
jgi:hypothetical protein